MLSIYIASYLSVRVNCNVVKIQDDPKYNTFCLYFIDECEFTEVTTQNSVQTSILCMLYFLLCLGNQDIQKITKVLT